MRGVQAEECCPACASGSLVLQAFPPVKLSAFVLSILVAWSSSCYADFPLTDKLTQATVIRVVNGDTLDVFVPKFQRNLRVQLASADAIEWPNDSQANVDLLVTYGVPKETIQALHLQAVQLLQNLQGAQVTLEDAGPKDQYDRYPVFLWTGDRLVNKDLLSLGLAVYRQYQISPYDANLSAATTLAQSRKAGLWSYVWSPVAQYRIDPTSRPAGAIVEAPLTPYKGTITSIDEADGYLYLELDRSQCVRTNRPDLIELARSLKRGQLVELFYTVENGKSVLKKLKPVTW